MCAMGNTAYVESQRQASIALSVSPCVFSLRLPWLIYWPLQVFVKNIKSVEEQVKSIMGDDFFQLFIVRNDENFFFVYL